MPRLRILLLSPPLCEPGVPNLAIELLASMARQAGHHADTLHAALLQPKTFCDDLIHGLGAPGCFVPSYYDLDPVDVADELVAAVYADFGSRDRVPHARRDQIADKFFGGMLDAERCVRAIVDQIPPGYDIIGFSIGFDSQKLPGAAIAKALRRRGERALLVAGGTGTDDEMGAALLEQFPEFDLVIQGEAEAGWSRLLERVVAGEPPDTVPGCIYRRAGTLVRVPEAAPDQRFLSVPAPRYESFIAQRAASPYRDSKLIVMLETSRGCWWGRKHHCTFCGIRSVDEDYRVRPAEQAVALMTELYDSYRPDLLYCTDPIAPMSYPDTVWPALAEARRERDWRIFYETKSNLRRRHIAQMADAGITRVQPGIESLVTSSLRLMDKGATGIQQVAFLKWAHAYGITVMYGIITGMPGETAADLRSMVPMADQLCHLPPPADVNRLALHRFSPHFANPGGFGIHDVAPFRTQRVLYRCPDERLRRLCYQLDFRVPGQDTEEYERARDELVAAATRWRLAYLAGASLWLDGGGDRTVIGRSRTAGDLAIEVVEDRVERLLLEECGEVRSLGRVAQQTGYPVESLRPAARRLADRGLLLLDRGTALSLPVPTRVDARADAARPAPDQPAVPMIHVH